MNHESFSEHIEIDTWIINDLKKSGLSSEHIQIKPLLCEGEIQERLGFTKIKDNLGNSIEIIDIGGYWVTYPNVPDYYRLKLKHSVKTDTGKVKYLSPKKELGFGNHAYIPPQLEEILRTYKPDKPVFITEGEKKAVKATLEGFPCIGLPGVFGFKNKENDFSPELDKYVWKNRLVFMVFDSDIIDKHEVRRAELRLAIELSNRGAKVFSVRLPSESNGEKNGLDDYLVRYGAESFRELIEKAQPTLELHIDEGTDKELILEELPKLNNEIDKELVLKTLAKREGVKIDAVKTEYRKHIPKEKENNQSPQETFTEEQLEKAKSLLNSPNILLDMLLFTKDLGFIGEGINQQMLYLMFTSRLMDSSISAVVKGQSSSGKSHLVVTVLRLFPETEVLNFSFVTSKALVHRQGDLSNKILYIAEHSGSESADYSIRTLLSEGEISIMLPIKNEVTGNFETAEKRITARGLVFVETTTKDTIHAENQTRVFDLYVDESERQTANILTMQAAQLETDSAEVIEEIQVWRAAQSLLKIHSVYAPYALKLANTFPTHKTRARRDFQRLLSLIKAHTLLYQHQRETGADGRLIATLEDLSGVLPIIERVLEDSQKELSPKQAEVLNIIQSDKIPTDFGIGDVTDLVTVERKTLRRYLKYFANEGFIEWNGERGKKSLYTKISNPQSPLSPIGTFVSNIRELLDNYPEYSGHPQLSPNVPKTPITDDKGHRDNKGHSPLSPIKTNDKVQIREKNSIGDIGTEEHGGNIPAKDHKEAEPEDWEAETREFLGDNKKDVAI